MRIPQRPELNPGGIAPSIKAMENYAKTITSCSEGTSIVAWLINTLNLIPHGDGTTVADRLLANKLCEKLREQKNAIATEIATAICSELNSPDFRWQAMVGNIVRSFPQGKGYLSEQVKNAISSYDWLRDAPLLKLQPVF